MKTNETLDGSTAGFIAAIADALNRGISEDRMRELIGDHEKLRVLLLPLLSDDWAGMLQAHREARFGSSVKTKHLWITSASSGNPPTMRRIMKLAKRRMYSLLSEPEAARLWESYQVTERTQVGFPFIRAGKLRQFLYFGYRNNVKDEEVDLDAINMDILGRTYFFREGPEDGSGCYEC